MGYHENLEREEKSSAWSGIAKVIMEEMSEIQYFKKQNVGDPGVCLLICLASQLTSLLKEPASQFRS